MARSAWDRAGREQEGQEGEADHADDHGGQPGDGPRGATAAVAGGWSSVGSVARRPEPDGRRRRHRLLGVTVGGDHVHVEGTAGGPDHRVDDRAPDELGEPAAVGGARARAGWRSRPGPPARVRGPRPPRPPRRSGHRGRRGAPGSDGARRGRTPTARRRCARGHRRARPWSAWPCGPPVGSGPHCPVGRSATPPPAPWSPRRRRCRGARGSRGAPRRPGRRPTAGRARAVR